MGGLGSRVYGTWGLEVWLRCGSRLSAAWVWSFGVSGFGSRAFACGAAPRLLPESKSHLPASTGRLSLVT